MVLIFERGGWNSGSAVSGIVVSRFFCNGHLYVRGGAASSDTSITMVKMVLMSNLWFEMTVKLVVRDEAHTISLQTQVLNLEIRNMTCFYLPPTIS